MHRGLADLCTSHETTDRSSRTLFMNSPLLCCTPCCTSCKNNFPLPLLSPFFFSSYFLVSSCLFVCFLCSFLFSANNHSFSFLFSSFSLFSFSFFFPFLDLNTSRKMHTVIHLFSRSSLLPALFLPVRFLLGYNIILHSSSSI